MEAARRWNKIESSKLGQWLGHAMTCPQHDETRSVTIRQEMSSYTFGTPAICGRLLRTISQRCCLFTASDLQFSPYLHGDIRDLLRPFSDGLIDLQEKNAQAYAAERAENENARNQQLTLLQERIVTGREIVEALNNFHRLPDSHWPELTSEHLEWYQGVAVTRDGHQHLGRTLRDASPELGELARRGELRTNA